MPPAIEVLIYVAAFMLFLLLVRRVMLWRLEYILKEPLSRELDRIMAEVADHENRPMNDLHITRASEPFGQANHRRTLFFYELYLQGGERFELVREGAESSYHIVHWRNDVDAPYFPPWGLGTCRSFWFIDRMKKLTSLLDSYPREYLLSVRASRVADTLDGDEASHTNRSPA